MLAIYGGTAVRATLFPSQNTIGVLEKAEVNKVLDSGILTGYQGNWSSVFYGGSRVRTLEDNWAMKFNVRNAIACHSATAGLHIAIGAVAAMTKKRAAIVSPFSMTCSASLPLAWDSHVEFADIERDFYCISAESIKNMLYYYNPSVIIPVSLFGMAYDADNINSIAKEIGAYVIEDAAQAVGATLHGRYAGTLGDIGVFSFNLGKHLTCGEGGMIVTNNDDLAFLCRLIMNHAEAVVNSAQDQKCEWVNMHIYRKLHGFNLRMTEINAAIVNVQLERMDHLISQRVENVNYLIEKLRTIPCFEMPKFRPEATHSYYVLPLKYSPVDGIPRDMFVDAVKAELKPTEGREHEGVTIGSGYVRPISNMPLFGLPLDATPECTRQWQEELIIVHRMFGPNASRRDLDDIVNAFVKVYEHRGEISAHLKTKGEK